MKTKEKGKEKKEGKDEKEKEEKVKDASDDESFLARTVCHTYADKCDASNGITMFMSRHTDISDNRH